MVVLPRLLVATHRQTRSDHRLALGAHKSKSSGAGRDCNAAETSWHLLWKDVYHEFSGWEIEVLVILNGKRYRLDAARISTGKVREFVHSLSDAYVEKHLALHKSGYDVLWIYDGDEFTADRAKAIKGGGWKHLLKPKARWLHAQVGGLVHWDGQLFREWRSDCWYPLKGDLSQGLLRSYVANRQKRQQQGRIA